MSGLPCGVAYSASKGGVLAMTRSIAVEYAKRGVRANCVCPGDTKTGMTDGNVAFPENMDFDLMPRIMSLSGARGPETVASVIAMLASEDGIHITGEDIRVDGGTLCPDAASCVPDSRHPVDAAELTGTRSVPVCRSGFRHRAGW